LQELKLSVFKCAAGVGTSDRDSFPHHYYSTNFHAQQATIEKNTPADNGQHQSEEIGAHDGLLL
jgi:hypothetical protein